MERERDICEKTAVFFFKFWRQIFFFFFFRETDDKRVKEKENFNRSTFKNYFSCERRVEMKMMFEDDEEENNRDDFTCISIPLRDYYFLYSFFFY